MDRAVAFPLRKNQKQTPAKTLVSQVCAVQGFLWLKSVIQDSFSWTANRLRYEVSAWFRPSPVPA